MLFRSVSQSRYVANNNMNNGNNSNNINTNSSNNNNNNNNNNASKENSTNNNSDTFTRVKVWQVDAHSGDDDKDDEWHDKGTGHLTCAYIDGLATFGFVVKSEKEGNILLQTKIFPQERIYRLEQETLIVWRDPNTKIDWALSFQEVAGCNSVWLKIKEYQKELQQDYVNDEEIPNSVEVSGSETEENMPNDRMDLPPVTLSNLQMILNLIQQSTSSMYAKERLMLSILKERYLSKLFDLFQKCEDLEDMQSLKLLFLVFRNLILLNDTNLMEQLFSEQNMMQLMGVLEYDPELPTKQSHRKFLTERAKFRQIIPFNNKDLLAKIH